MSNTKERKEARKEAKDFVLTVFGQDSSNSADSRRDKQTIFAIRQAAFEGDWDVVYDTLGLIEDYIKDLKY